MRNSSPTPPPPRPPSKGLSPRLLIAGALGVALGLALTGAAKAGPTLDAIKARGAIKAGVGSQPGFFAPDSSGRCDALIQDASDLAIIRTQLPKHDDYVLLPERISKEPLAPAVRYGDDQWLEIVNWAVHATIQAEELGIAQANVDSFLSSTDPSIRRFLGVDPSLGEAAKLDPKFAYTIIKTVGNCGEIFERHAGPKTKVGLERGYNAPWTQGGLLYAPPFR